MIELSFAMLVACAVASSVFFFKQKTAYEMRISDWSSDVCSSDLLQPGNRQGPAARPLFLDGLVVGRRHSTGHRGDTGKPGPHRKLSQIGRAPCRERVCQYVSI